MIVVHVHDPGVRRSLSGHLVGVLSSRQASPDVQELPDPRLASQVLHCASQEGAVSLHTGQDIRVGRDDLLGSVPVGLSR
jgi:hypothetical protein